MKVLVVGGAGYIGSVTTELLADTGHQIAVFDSFERGHREAVDSRATLYEGDLRDCPRIVEVMRDYKPDAVMHFAAYALVGESMEQPNAYFSNNVSGGLNLLSAMLATGVNRLVFSSTCATYGEPTCVPISEEEPQTPTNPYGESKLMFEKALKWCHDIHGMQTVYLRYFNASGATEKYGEDHAPETHLIPLILQVPLGKREHVFIFGNDYETTDGTCVRDYIHIVDLADAHIRALSTDYSGPLNLGNGNGYSVMEVIKAARDVTGLPIDAKIAPRRQGDPARLVALADRAHDVLGWRPRYADLHNIIESAWKWHKKHPDGYGC